MSNYTRSCNKCGIEYPLTSEYFRRDAQKSDGFQHTCKYCRGVKPPRDTTPIDFGDTVGVPLTQGFIAIIDRIDIDLAYKTWSSCIPKKRKVYAGRDENGIRVYLHHMIYERIAGRKLNKGETVDHIDVNPLNNRRNNLRLATSAQQMYNKPRMSNNKSGYKGVHFCPNLPFHPWTAVVTKAGKRFNLGYFSTPEEAYHAYCEKAKELFGEFARLE